MTNDKAVSHYNRLEGVSRIITELANAPGVDTNYKDNLAMALSHVLSAQGDLPWSPDKIRR